ncbi:MAG: DUF445 family protein [Chitinivibrionales bacterium]|nr:DUF445 family protein [Chitinivibrionales bacterium]MBD3355536.1 DUF445 family protein [Chitinivibrionales bacterium]
MNSRIVVYALIPVVSALIGWLTNFIAVRMIFRPRRPVRVLGITIEGLIPRRKSDLARKIGETVEKELISHEDIRRVADTPSFRNRIIDVIFEQIERFIMQSLGANPLVAAFLSGEAAASLRVMLREELQNRLPDITEELFGRLESHLDFKEIIREKIESFDLTRFESIVYSIASRELKAIEVVGGVLGFVVGLVQVAIIVTGNLYA